MTNVNWKVRVKNKTFWLALIPALLLLAQAVAAVFGLTLDLSEVGDRLLTVVNALFAVARDARRGDRPDHLGGGRQRPRADLRRAEKDQLTKKPPSPRREGGAKGREYLVTARDIFSAAMSIMDELSATGEAANSDTREYEQRTPAILNVLLTELKVLRGDDADWLPLEGMDEPVPGGDELRPGRHALRPRGEPAGGREPHGGELLPSSATRNARPLRLAAKASVEDIDMLYGGVGEGRFARW